VQQAVGAKGVIRIACVAAILVGARTRVAGVRVIVIVPSVRVGMQVPVAGIAREAVRKRRRGVRVAVQLADLGEERARNQSKHQHQQQGKAQDITVAADEGHRPLA
jgi:hypothetical protein